MKITAIVGAALLTATFAALSPVASAQQALLTVDQAFRITGVERTAGNLAITWAIAPEYAVYKDKVKVTPGDPAVHVNGVTLPAGQIIDDPAFGRVAVYRNQLAMSVPYTTTGTQEGQSVLVQIQGCHKVEPLICFPPYTVKVQLDSGASG